MKISKKIAASATFLFIIFLLAQLFAQDVAELENRVSALSKDALPKTVSIKCFVEDFGRYGSGSGAIISSDGYILTCAHVVPQKEDIEVTLSDGRKFKAKRLGQNDKNDFALLKIDAQGLQFFELGNSDTLKVGDWVIAFGHPGGQREDCQPSVALGRVRGLHKRIPTHFFLKYYSDAIQSDAPLSPGNSGGPLVDLSGKLVGINGVVMIFAGRTYSVSINEVKKVLDDLKEGKDVEGVMPESITEMMKELRGEFPPEELKRYIDRVMKKFFGGESEEIFKEMEKWLSDEQFKRILEQFEKFFGKIPEEGDILDELRKLLQEQEKEKRFEGIPDEEIRKLLDELLGEKTEERGGKEREKEPKAYLGVSLSEVGEALRSQLGISNGLIVEEVKKGSPAEAANLAPRDIILKIDGREVGTLSDIKGYLSTKKPGDKTTLTVIKKGIRKEIEVTLGER